MYTAATTLIIATLTGIMTLTSSRDMRANYSQY